MIKNNIECVSLISAALCNLNCSFCYLPKNQAYKEFHKQVIEAFENKTYIKNAYNTVCSLNSDPLNVKIFQFWGGESLYCIDKIIDNIEEIYLYFPSVNNFKISTNFLVKISDLCNLFKKIEECATQPTQFDLQLSIDGPGKIAKEGHNGDFEHYKANFKQMADFLNNNKFNKLTINVSINATLNKDTYLEYFNNIDKMEEYMKYMNDFCQYCNNLALNKCLQFDYYFIFPRSALPSENDTTEYGAYYGISNYLWEKVKGKNKYFKLSSAPFFESSMSMHPIWSLFYGNEECSEGKSGITILPDGTACECSSTFIQGFKPYQDELKKQNDEKELVHSILTSKLNFNPAIASQKEIEEYQWSFREGYKGTNSTIILLSMATCIELAKSGQIPRYYLNNLDQLLKDIIQVNAYSSCTRENLRSTKISYLISPGTYRRYFNGAIQFSNAFFDSEKILRERDLFNNDIK